MKIAFVDLMFSWPPHGGADVDLYEVMRAAMNAGHEVRLFATRNTGSWERGIFDADALPFPAERIDVPPRDFNHRRLPGLLREAVVSYAPQLVYFGFGLFLKPHVIAAFDGYPKIARYYSYEAACQRNFQQQLDTGPCPKDYFGTPNFCRQCGLDGQAAALRGGVRPVWTEEYLAAEAYQPEYYALARRALASLDAAIVYNPRMAAPLEDLVERVLVVPGGVDLSTFPQHPEEPRTDGKHVILMTGRCEDPLKGVAVLREAGERLAAARDDFEIVVTLPEDSPRTSWFRPAGWRSHDEVRQLYREAAICVVPVDTEAMRAAKNLVATPWIFSV